MGLKFDSDAETRRWLETGLSAAGLTLSLVEANPFRALASIRSGLRSLRPTPTTAAKAAWQTFVEALTLSISDWVIAHRLFSDQSIDVIDSIGEFINGIEGSLNAYELEADHLNSPHIIPLFQSAKGHFLNYYNANHSNLSFELEAVFATRWHEATLSAEERFGLISRALNSESGKASNYYATWNAYHDQLRRDVEENLLFGQQEGGVSLADIYLPLRCSWVTKKRPTTSESPNEVLKTFHVAWLLDELNDWLDTADPSDELRVIAGGPGSGKSSSARMFAASVAREQKVDVFVTPLQGLDVSGEVPEVIAQHIAIARSGARPMPENPINSVHSRPKRLLLVFDGLDEVRRPDVGGNDATRRFVSKVRQWLRLINAQRQSNPIFAIILGRPGAAEEAARETDLDGRAVLRVEPLIPINNKYRIAGCSDLSDPQSLADQDHREKYWKNYATATSKDVDTPSILTDIGLIDLTSEPLLMYLLIFSEYIENNEDITKLNKNIVYKNIFEKLHKRDRDEKASNIKDGIDTEKFFILMECLGLAAWREGGRTGSSKNFEDIRDRIYAPKLAREFRNLTAADLKNVALQFYTQPTSSADDGYEFIHKSFGEYLTARAIVRFAARMASSYLDSGREEEAAIRWLSLTGTQALNPDIVLWMKREATLMHLDGTRYEQSSLRELVEGLSEIFNWTLKNGFPAHGDQAHGSWVQRTKQQANAEHSLMVAINCISEAAYPANAFMKPLGEGGWEHGPIKIDWGAERISSSEPRSLFWRNPRSTSELQTFVDRLNLAGIGIEDYSLSRMDLSGVSLSSLELNGVDLSYSSFKGSTITHCLFYSANLNNVNFEDANLQNTRFPRANLSGALFDRADISDTHFQYSIIMSHITPNSEVIDNDTEQIKNSVAKGLNKSMFSNSIMSKETHLPPEIYDHYNLSSK